MRVEMRNFRLSSSDDRRPGARAAIVAVFDISLPDVGLNLRHLRLYIDRGRKNTFRVREPNMSALVSFYRMSPELHRAVRDLAVRYYEEASANGD
ncbi:hypothetical protein [Caenispirillum bisanense]|uniref:hypothetical protein n=1 Tax=Caenispirillum bisanense TaxID=414052 RepID=UPI0031E3C1BB